jgi:hypothetical protein
MLNNNNNDEGNYHQNFCLLLYSAGPCITMGFSLFSVSVSYTNIFVLLLYKCINIYFVCIVLLIFPFLKERVIQRLNPELEMDKVCPAKPTRKQYAINQ